jgi:tetracenomycin F1 monooxygenase
VGKINQENGYYTLVNVFTVSSPEDQRRMFNEIVAATGTIREFPGFVSANVHLSYDGSRVVNYAQWCSKTQFDDMRASPRVQQHFAACRAITDDIEPIFCEVSYIEETVESWQPE